MGVTNTLKINSTVTYTILDGNKISNKGSTALVKAPTTNAMINIIRLRNNKIGDDEVTALEDALNSNTTITIIRLRNNKIGVLIVLLNWIVVIIVFF